MKYKKVKCPLCGLKLRPVNEYTNKYSPALICSCGYKWKNKSS